MFRERLNGVLVTAAPVLLSSTRNCTPVLLGETLVEIVMAPETVAPEAGEMKDAVGGEDVAEILLFALITLRHPVQNCARGTSRQNRDPASA